jgi:hypothetical protein
MSIETASGTVPADALATPTSSRATDSDSSQWPLLVLLAFG